MKVIFLKFNQSMRLQGGDPGGDGGGGGAGDGGGEEEAGGGEVDFDGVAVSAVVAGVGGEAGGGVDDAGGADGGEDVGVVEGVLDFVHVVGHFTEPDDVWAESAGFVAGGADVGGGEVVLVPGGVAAGGAEAFADFAMHVEEVFGAGAVVKVVDVLGDQEEGPLPCPVGFELGQRVVGGVGVDGFELGAPEVVEAVDGFGIFGEGAGGGDVLDAVVFP